MMVKVQISSHKEKYQPNMSMLSIFQNTKATKCFAILSPHRVSPWIPRHKEVIVRSSITSSMRCAKRAYSLRESTIDTKRAHQTHLSWPLPLRRKHASTQWNCI